MHPSHEGHLGKLNRVSGQVNAVKRMIEDKKYCVDIMIQIKAIRNALKSIEMGILESHMHTCLTHACQADKTGQPDLQHREIERIIKLLKKYD